jgi:uncharacterized membrane protein
VSENLHVVTGEKAANRATGELGYSRTFLLLLVVGILIVLIRMMLLVVVSLFYSHGSSANFGVVIFLGPIPIVMGACSEPFWTILVAAVLAMLTIMALLLARKRRKETNS